MSKSVENMEVSGVEDTEKKYFQEVSGLDNSTDHSMDSLQGSMSVPTFSMNQSGVLQGSHGFQVYQSSNVNTSLKSDDLNSYTQMSSGNGGSIHLAPSGVGPPQFMTGIQHVTSGTAIPGSTLIFSHSQLGALNVLTGADKLQLVFPKDNQDKSQTQYSKIAIKSETIEGGSIGGSENVEGGSSDEKSGKCKASPKRRGRKSRSTSSTGNEMNVKTESVAGPSPCRIDSSDAQQTGDVGIKPSLLDEILTEKKKALMRSPEVMKILQQQQQMLEKEKRITHSKTIES